MPRFILTELAGTEGLISGDDAHHLIRVHRVRSGDTLEVTFAGSAFRGVVERIDDQLVGVKILDTVDLLEPPVAVYLMPALLKGDKLELVIQKAVELGISSISPVQCERSIVPAGKAVSKLDRWQKIAREAAKQSGRSHVPEVLAPVDFARAVSGVSSELRLMAHETGTTSLCNVLQGGSETSTVTLLVGPEGGFTAREVDLAEQSGFRVVSMGPRIMRAETASLALLSVVMYKLGDLG